MVAHAQATPATPTRTRARKPAPPVLVDPADVAAGIYGALSSDGERWYSVNVAARTCTCKAGQDGFARCRKGACKHLIAARVIARALAGMAPAERAAALRLQNIRVHVEKVDLAALDAPVTRAVRPDAAGALLDAYPTAA